MFSPRNSLSISRGDLLLVFVNKVVLEHSHAIHLHIVCGGFRVTVAELSGDRGSMARKAENILKVC